mgnify:CR=1 FL=1|tara:strand:+ start:28085 stop:28627 length:543 start_codon:yes stop_codon:yes gene_type:complete
MINKSEKYKTALSKIKEEASKGNDSISTESIYLWAEESLKEIKKVDLYVDGSFRDGRILWAYVIVENDKNIWQGCGGVKDPNAELLSGRQVGGECLAVIEGVKHCALKGMEVNIYYDYTGLRNWISDIFGDTPWKANKSYTKEYRNFCLEHRDNIIGMTKVKSHSGIKWNEYVDQLMVTL